MAPTIMVPCPACGCHAKAHEIECPHCGERIRRADGTIPRTAAAILLGLTAVATAHCGPGGGSGGMGGMGGMAIVSTSHYGFAATTSGSSTTGDDACVTGADCAQCPDFNACVACEEGNNPSGVVVFNDLLDCVYCTACYTVCDGETAGCTMAPATKDACDSVVPSAAACADRAVSPPTGCVPCSEAGTCKPQFDACKASTACAALQSAIEQCPHN